MIYRFENFELDLDTFELRSRGQAIHMEPQVFSVLAHLVKHRDRVVSKIELLDEVWLDRFVSESALTSRIQAARRACGDSGREQRVIRTRHGRGYRFVADVVEDGDTQPAVRGPSQDRVPPRADDPPATDGPAQNRVIGRDLELETIDAVIGGIATGSGAAIFVSGRAGFGKSTLVEAALERSDTDGDLTIVRAQCRARKGVSEPYVALLEAIGRLGREHGAPVAEALERVAPLWLMQLPSLVDTADIEALERRTLGGTPYRMLREGVDFFHQLGRSHRLVLVIEDLHWADPSTLEVVEWLADSAPTNDLVLIATHRPADVEAPDLLAILARLTTNTTIHRVPLHALDAQSVRDLAAERLEATSIADDLATILSEHSGGNPLFITEEVDSWLRSDSVVIDHGHVQAAVGVQSLAAAIPEGLGQLIQLSIDGLDPDDRALLETAAVVGREFPAFAVAAASTADLETVEAQLVSLARREQLITAVGDEVWPDGSVSTVFRLTHDVHQQLLYERIPTSRRAMAHQRVGERLEAAFAHRSDEHVATLARHFVASGDAQRAVTYLHRSGERALERSSYAEAVEALEDALRLIANVPETEDRNRTEVAIRASLGPALIATLGWQRSEIDANYQRAMTLCQSTNPPPERFIVRYGLASVHELRGEYDRSEELLREQLADGPGLGVETQELLACSTFHQGAYEDSLGYATRALASWDEEQHSTYMARYGEHPGVSCNTWGALAAWHLGDPARALTLAHRAIDWGAANEYALATARIQLAFLHQHRGDRDQMLIAADETIELATAQGFPFRVAQAHILRAWYLATEDPTPSAVTVCEEALDSYRIFGARMDDPYFAGLIADAALGAHQPERALVYLDGADATIAETTREFFYRPELLRLRAVAVAQQSAEPARVLELLDAAEAAAAAQTAIPMSLKIALTKLDLGINDETVKSTLRAIVERYGDRDSFTDLDRARALL